jgi:hypothetical protein
VATERLNESALVARHVVDQDLVDAECGIGVQLFEMAAEVARYGDPRIQIILAHESRRFRELLRRTQFPGSVACKQVRSPLGQCIMAELSLV